MELISHYRPVFGTGIEHDAVSVGDVPRAVLAHESMNLRVEDLIAVATAVDAIPVVDASPDELDAADQVVVPIHANGIAPRRVDLEIRITQKSPPRSMLPTSTLPGWP